MYQKVKVDPEIVGSELIAPTRKSGGEKAIER
jgi:hypothetical protein